MAGLLTLILGLNVKDDVLVRLERFYDENPTVKLSPMLGLTISRPDPVLPRRRAVSLVNGNCLVLMPCAKMESLILKGVNSLLLLLTPSSRRVFPFSRW